MEDRFKELGMTRDAADYVKVANILFVYRMILCLDQYRYVDPWVWALAEDVERWNTFPWGAYSYQSLMHYIGLIPRTREAMGGKGSGQYHFYGPIWALQSRVVMLEPSPEETATSYYMSMQLEPGAQSVRFVPARSGNKKKMLANVASCCSTSAKETGRQETSQPSSSRALRDEPDHTETGAPSPTEDAPVHTADSIDPESPPRAWGMKRSRRDRTPSSGEPSKSFIQRVVDQVMPRVQELIDTTIAPRVQDPEPSHHSATHRPPSSPGVRAPQPTVVQEGPSTLAPHHGGFSATYQLMNGIDDSSLRPWFDELEDPRNELKDMHMSYFLSAIARRVKRDPGCPTAVANTGLYEALVGAWKILHPIDPLCRATYGDDDYRRWRPTEGLVHRIQGSDGQYQVAWKGRDYAIMVCDVSGEHWVVVRIRFSDWVVELYDSLLFQMDDPSDRVEYERRDRELMPLLCLLPHLLICADFWEGRPMPPRCAFAMTLDKSIPDQYVQTDATSCGVYACMYVERLLGTGPPPDISEQAVHEYRKVIGARIYSLTYIHRPGV
ncbi:hypothetical protein C2S51_020580 [Perilla frutescens var. frutescens]|nr:hypothetical protein C2S51_020580 [Perilla frutescens var. frutescens]